MAERPVSGSPGDAIEKALQAHDAIVGLAIALVEQGIVPPDRAQAIMDAVTMPFPPVVQKRAGRMLDRALVDLAFEGGASSSD